MKKIVSLDLGCTTGYAYQIQKDIIESGFVNFKQNRFSGAGMRFVNFNNWLEKLLKELKSIDLMFFESVHAGHKGIQAAHVYGGFLATLMAFCERNSIPYEGVAPQTIKKFISGSGRASKQGVIWSLKARGYDVTDDNEADALALLFYVRNKMG